MNIIGIDVSKAKLDCVWLKGTTTGQAKSKVLANTPSGYDHLLKWIQTQTGQGIEQAHVIMEATGVYHEALAYALYQAGARVSVVNPAQVKHYADSLGTRSKTDKQDARVIARYGATQTPDPWQPEPEEIRHLKALLARLEALEQDIRREENRLEKAHIACAADEVNTSIQIVLSQLKKEKQRLEALIDQHIDQHPGMKKDRQLLQSIPGVGPVLSRNMLAVLRSRPFRCASQCAAYLGLIPIQHQSGSSVRGRSRLSKTGPAKVRAKLYMAAIVSIQHNPDIKRQYQRLVKSGKAKMAALCAGMRKLVHICFGVLKHQRPYQPQVL